MMAARCIVPLLVCLTAGLAWSEDTDGAIPLRYKPVIQALMDAPAPMSSGERIPQSYLNIAKALMASGPGGVADFLAEFDRRCVYPGLDGAFARGNLLVFTLFVARPPQERRLDIRDDQLFLAVDLPTEQAGWYSSLMHFVQDLSRHDLYDLRYGSRVP